MAEGQCWFQGERSGSSALCRCGNSELVHEAHGVENPPRLTPDSQ
jgi:hypothetical protein